MPPSNTDSIPLRSMNPQLIHDIHPVGLEVVHGFEISDGAFVTAADTPRNTSPTASCPTATNLADEAASVLRLAQESKPHQLDALEPQIGLEGSMNETDTFSAEGKRKVEEELHEKRELGSGASVDWRLADWEARLDKATNLKKQLGAANY